MCHFLSSNKIDNGISLFLKSSTKSFKLKSLYSSFLLHQFPRAYLGIKAGLPVIKK